jgi:hypothetical protein
LDWFLPQAAVDLCTHDVAVGGGVIEPAQKGGGEHLPGVLEIGDLLVEVPEPPAGDCLPFRHIGGVEDSTDFVECQPGVLKHADKDESAESLGAIAALTGLAGVGAEQSLAFVVADGRGGDVSALRYLADGEEVGHDSYLT